jgi:hypothetical protein
MLTAFWRAYLRHGQGGDVVSSQDEVIVQIFRPRRTAADSQGVRGAAN